MKANLAVRLLVSDLVLQNAFPHSKSQSYPTSRLKLAVKSAREIQGKVALLINKKPLTESDICDQFISKALVDAGWEAGRWRREYPFTDGRIIVRGNLIARKTKASRLSSFL